MSIVKKTWGIKQQEYALVVKKDYWTIDEAAMYLASYYLRSNKYVSKEAADTAYNKVKQEMIDILTISIQEENLPVKKKCYYENDGYEKCLVTDYLKCLVKPLTLIRWAIEYDMMIPDAFAKMLPWYGKAYLTSSDNDIQGYEDIISDEIIAALKELPLPEMRKKVADLTSEKKKWDASIIAATKIGLLFYEEGLHKPATRNLFIAEYKKHFDKLPSLQNTTIERIYKHLPDGYRRTTDGGKVAGEQHDIHAIIKAAVFAGYMEGTQGDVTGSELTSALRGDGCAVPDEKSLQIILEAMSKLK